MSTLNPPAELSQIETLLTTLVATSKCACHIINPNKTRILMWKEIKDETTIYYLRIGIQKFISHEQTDRNGEIYWRYWTGSEKTTTDSAPIINQDETNPTEQSVNSPTN